MFDEEFRAELRSLFALRRDVRHFTSDPVDRELLATLLRDANMSPSVGFSQPWRFVLVDDSARRAAVIASYERANADALGTYDAQRGAKYAALKLAGLREAPVHLAVFCDDETTTGTGLGAMTMPETRRYSCVMAIYTFWLLARTHGIGAGWVSILDPAEVTRALDVPQSWTFVAYLCVGYPTHYDAMPELQRVGWESPDARAAEILVR